MAGAPGQDPFLIHLQGLGKLSYEASAASLADRSAERLGNLVRRLERIADKEIDALGQQVDVLAEQGHSQKIACRMGCWHCCTQQVAASIPEILWIADHIRAEWSEEQQAALWQRMDSYMAATLDYRESKTDLKPRHVCPLLQDAACSVWKVRPFVCRGWNSVDVDACIAKKDDPAGDPMIPQIMGQLYMADSIRAGLRGALRLHGLESALCELIPGLAVALKEPDAADRFLSGTNPFADAMAQTRLESLKTAEQLAEGPGP